MHTVKIDKRGRILIPLVLRKNKGLFVGQKMLLQVSGETIIVKPYKYKCKICGADIPEGSDIGQCPSCIEKRTIHVY